jgi:hypothetical protein
VKENEEAVDLDEMFQEETTGEPEALPVKDLLMPVNYTTLFIPLVILILLIIFQLKPKGKEQNADIS